MKHRFGPATAGIMTLAAYAAIGCSEASTSPRLAVTDQDAVAMQLAINDVRTRVVPTLGSGDAATGLARSLECITSALGQRDPGALRIAIGQAEAALDGLASIGGEHASAADAELDVVRLALDNARSMITPR